MKFPSPPEMGGSPKRSPPPLDNYQLSAKKMYHDLHKNHHCPIIIFGINEK